MVFIGWLHGVSELRENCSIETIFGFIGLYSFDSAESDTDTKLESSIEAILLRGFLESRCYITVSVRLKLIVSPLGYLPDPKV